MQQHYRFCNEKHDIGIRSTLIDKATAETLRVGFEEGVSVGKGSGRLGKVVNDVKRCDEVKALFRFRRQFIEEPVRENP